MSYSTLAVRSAICTLTLAVCATFMAAAGDPTEERGHCEELSIEAVHSTGTRFAGSWFLTVESGGAAVLNAGGEDRRFNIPDSACAELVHVVKQERFFDLKGVYGTAVIDASWRELEIALGEEKHSVRLLEDAYMDADEDAVRRALRVWMVVRSLFSAKDAEDSREKDRLFLERSSRE